MPAPVRSRLTCAVLVTAIAGCGSGAVAPAVSSSDAGATSGLEAGADAAADATSNVGSDTGANPTSDAASFAETGSVSDASSGAEAGSAKDASSVADSGPVDAGGVSTDAGMPPYKGVANSACNDLITLGATWYYNWEVAPPCSSPQFVPMVWGHTGAEQTEAGITSEISTMVSQGYKFVLGFNEPDNASQSDISVADAIALWPAFNNPSVLVGSPASQANTSGQTWFKSFMSTVNADTTGTLRVDFITAHWYGWNSGSCDAEAANLESYIDYLEGIPGNRPIWLTEWGCLNDSNPDAATVQAFFSGAITMFTKHPRLVRYAWYPWTTNNELVTSTDTLTSLGTVFAAEPAYK
jgi:hypothetical protein